MGRAFSLVIVEAEAEDAENAAQALRGLGFLARGAVCETLGETLKDGACDAVVSHTPLTREEVGDRLWLSACGAPDAASDLRLRPPAHTIQIAARLRQAIRLQVLERAAALRAADAESAGAPPAPVRAGADPSSVLFVGAPCPAFMRIQHAMAGAEIETVAAFSTFNAFDYLHERAFDAVILNTDPDADLAHTVCSAMRRNTRLYHTPAILLTRGDGYAGADEAFARGASDLLRADSGSDEMRERVTALTGERRRRRAAKALLEACRNPVLLDEDSDLFAGPFGERHLASLMRDAHGRGHGVSMVGLRVSAPHEAGEAQTRAALRQFAGMLRHCVRAEDLAVRARHDAFYLALPSTSVEEARMVAARVSAIAECTAYEGADPHRPFRLSLATRVLEPDADWSAADTVAAALAPSGPRAVAAVG